MYNSPKNTFERVLSGGGDSFIFIATENEPWTRTNKILPPVDFCLLSIPPVHQAQRPESQDTGLLPRHPAPSQMLYLGQICPLFPSSSAGVLRSLLVQCAHVECHGGTCPSFNLTNWPGNTVQKRNKLILKSILLSQHLYYCRTA